MHFGNICLAAHFNMLYVTIRIGMFSSQIVCCHVLVQAKYECNYLQVLVEFTTSIMLIF